MIMRMVFGTHIALDCASARSELHNIVLPINRVLSLDQDETWFGGPFCLGA